MVARKLCPANGQNKTLNWQRVSAFVALILLIVLPTLAMANEFMATGSYTGDGLESQTISGLGFEPGFVMIKTAAAKRSFAKTTAMPGDLSKNLAKNDALKSGYINSLNLDGFTVGNKAEVNELGVEYYWVAMMSRDGSLEIGEYTGDGADFREIPLNNMYPVAGLIMSSEGELPVYRHKDMESLEGYALDGSGQVDNSFAYFGLNQFTIRTGNQVNKNGVTYYYIT
jgi:hypothetical protein